MIFMANLTLIYGLRLLPEGEVTEIHDATLKLATGHEAHVTMHLIEGSRASRARAKRSSFFSSRLQLKRSGSTPSSTSTPKSERNAIGILPTARRDHRSSLPHSPAFSHMRMTSGPPIGRPHGHGGSIPPPGAI
jgi:hypothetical protein